MKMRHKMTDLAVISTPFSVMALSMTRTVPHPPASKPSPDPKQGARTQAIDENPSLSIWGSPPKVWAKWGWRVLFICAACVVAWQSLQPASMEKGLPHVDKLIHFIAYGSLMFLGLLSAFRIKAVYLVVGLILFGILLEILQGTMNLGRTLSVADAFANMAGVLLIFFLWQKAK